MKIEFLLERRFLRVFVPGGHFFTKFQIFRFLKNLSFVFKRQRFFHARTVFLNLFSELFF